MSEKPIQIRPERPEDAAAIEDVNRRAFGRPEEAALVAKLRATGKIALSLVAEAEDEAIGHILFSPMTIEGDGKSWPAVGLGPMAVIPSRQRQGVGGRLIRAGLDACRELGHSRALVLGHPEYYPRFGFRPASRFGVACEYDVPDPAFMALALLPGAFDGVSGAAKYAPEFNDAV